MDIALIRDKLLGWGKKYRYVFLVLLVGILLMLLPTGTKKEEKTVSATPLAEKQHLDITADMLEEILSQIKGAGRVEVLLTYAAGERTVFQTDERTASSESGEDTEHQTVLFTDSNRGESALVTQILPPQYLGAIVVCQGADNPSVKLAVSEAVSKATGLGIDRISVLKMK